MMPQTPCALVCAFVVMVAVGYVGHAEGALTGSQSKDGVPEKMASNLEVSDGPPSGDHLEEHQLRKRFIWTLTQEPYFYGKLDGGDGSGISHGSELLPEPLPLTKSNSMHKRLYPRWYHTYIYKPSTFSPMPRSAGERKRFQPFHPMARFRGLSMGGGSSRSTGYHSFDLPLSDQPGHPVPSAPNAQPSPKYNPSAPIAPMDEEAEQEAEEEEVVRAGELLQYLRSLASDRGLSANTKSFRFGISRRK